MQKLDDWNKKRTEQIESLNDNSPRLNGIECPKCGCELFDSAPMITMTSSPPKKSIMCNACGYTGYRIA